MVQRLALLSSASSKATITSKTCCGITNNSALPRMAYGDINNDGRLDPLLSTNGGRAYLFENDATGEAARQKSLRIKLVGTKSNRDGIGTEVRITAAGETQSQMLRSGSSYLSASELVLTFGLARHDRADSIEIRWPSGQVEKLSNIAAGQTITVTEGKGVTASRTYGAP